MKFATEPGVLRRPSRREWLALAAGARQGVVVHASQTWSQSVGRGDFDFFVRLAGVLAAEQRGAWLLSAETAAARLLLRLRPAGLQQLLIGTPPHAGRWDFHALPAYVPGFWMLDRRGVGASASIAALSYDEGAQDDAAAAAFAARLQAQIVAANLSKFAQPARGAALPQAAAVVFVQDIDDHRRQRAWLDTGTMLAVLAEASRGARVWVKLHPQQRPHRAALVRGILARWPHLHETGASVHDLVAASAVVVTQNSATGFEALLQRRAVITCAPSDYHHATRVAKTPQGLRAALAEVAAGVLPPVDPQRYVHWYLTRQCLEPQAADFATRLRRRLAPGG